MEENVEAGTSIELEVLARPRRLAGLDIRRVLPARARRMVGPFAFLDHIGPVQLEAGEGMDVLPHPHIGLATVTYLFEGEFLHRDSVGSRQNIRPGDVNWMIAGRGIAHSERTPAELRSQARRLHGVQSWVALPEADEEMAPSFEHHPASDLPLVIRPGVELRVIAGTAYGARAPTRVLSPTLYVHAKLQPGASLQLDDEHAERAFYVVDGNFTCEGRPLHVGTLVVLRPGATPSVASERGGSFMFLGGSPLDGPRHIWWNFVATSKDRIERAKQEWRDGRFAKIPGDDREHVPLPEL